MASGDKAKLHRAVLNRCLPSLVRDLDFKAVSIFIQQMELFNDITFRDISEQTVTSDRIEKLIHRLQQGDESTYDKFKECLFLSKQEYLKDILEKEETKVYMEINKKQQETREKKNVSMAVEEKHEIQHAGSGPVVCSSIMHNFKSYNDIHEGKGKEGIGEQSLTPALSSISFMDGKIVLKEHYDVYYIL